MEFARLIGRQRRDFLIPGSISLCTYQKKTILYHFDIVRKMGDSFRFQPRLCGVNGPKSPWQHKKNYKNHRHATEFPRRIVYSLHVYTPRGYLDYNHFRFYFIVSRLCTYIHISRIRWN